MKCSVCGKEFTEIDPKLTKMLANLPRHFAELGRETECRQVVTADVCSVKCMKKKLKEYKHT